MQPPDVVGVGDGVGDGVGVGAAVIGGALEESPPHATKASASVAETAVRAIFMSGATPVNFPNSLVPSEGTIAP